MQWMEKSAAPASLCFLPPLMRDVMHMKNRYLALFLSFSSMLMSVDALSNSSYLCESTELLNCLDLQKKQCVIAKEKAMDLCSAHYELETKDYDAVKKIAKEAGECSFNQFLLIAGINKNELKACDSYFIDAVNNNYKDISTRIERAVR